MNWPAQKPAPFGEALRHDAERRVQNRQGEIPPATVEQLQSAVEELHIYEAELEIQNEELIEGRTQIEEAHQKYFRHFDLAPIGLIRVNGVGLVVEANLLGARMLGVNRSQFYLGKRPFLAHVAPDSQGAFQQHFQNAFRSGTPETCELKLRKATGVETFVRIQSVRSRGEGDVQELYVSLTDLTDHRRTEAALAAQKDVADAATRAAEAAKLAKEQFFAMLSHELRTPLTPVLALIDQLEATPGRGTDDLAALAVMRRNLELEARLVDDLLDLNRLTNGKLQLQRERTDVHLCLAEAVEICRGDLEARELFFELDAGAVQHFAHADGKRLQQVFWNLLSNAVKFTPAGGRVAIRTRNAADRLIVEFNDTGVGIESTALDRIFDPFMQADASVPRRFGGLGLGLAIARSIAESHGGRLSVTSAGAGRGSTFQFELPLAYQPGAEAPPPSAQLAGAATRKTARLLLVEDHDDTRHALQLILQRRGYAVEGARDAASARALCAAQPFDLLITDIGLPDVSGCELLHELDRGYRLRGIAMSGFGTDNDLAESKAAGFLDHLVKPLDLEELDAAIQRAAPEEVEPASPDSSHVQSGDDGFAEFVDEHFPAAYQLAFCMTLSASRAAQLTEAVFAKAPRPLQRAVNPADDRRALLAALHRDWVAQGSSEAPPSTPELPPVTDDGANAAQRDAAAMMTIVHRMPAEVRLVLSLFYFEQLSHADIALILGVPNETAIALIAAAKTSLRRQLEEERDSSSVPA